MGGKILFIIIKKEITATLGWGCNEDNEDISVLKKKVSRRSAQPPHSPRRGEKAEGLLRY